MDIPVVLAALLAAMFWGMEPVLSKRGFVHGADTLYFGLLVVATGAVTFWGVLLATGSGISISPSGIVIFAVGGLIGTALGRVTNLVGVDRVGASINSAIVATNPVIATVLAFFFLGESITLIQAGGVIVVVTGLIRLTIARGGDLGGWQPRELVFPLAAAAAFGAGNVIRRFGLVVTSADPMQAIAVNESAALVMLVAYAVAIRDTGIPPLPARAYGFFIASGLASALGLLMLFVALQSGRVAIVTTLSGTSTLFATALSAFVLRDLERVSRGIVVGAALVVVGVGLIAFA